VVLKGPPVTDETSLTNGMHLATVDEKENLENNPSAGEQLH